MEKEYFPVIILIIASDNNPAYLKSKKILTDNYLLFNDKIRFFYLYCKSEEYTNEYDLCFSGCKESIYPGLYYKTAKAVKFLNRYYNYDFLIRTNLSTFWNINNLFNLIKGLPKEKCAIGAYSDIDKIGYIKCSEWNFIELSKLHEDENMFIPYQKFLNELENENLPILSGYSIILSKDVSESLFINTDPFDNLLYYSIEDDVMIGKRLKDLGYKIKRLDEILILPNNTYCEDTIKNISDNDFNRIIAYRCVCYGNRYDDAKYMADLFKRFKNNI